MATRQVSVTFDDLDPDKQADLTAWVIIGDEGVEIDLTDENAKRLRELNQEFWVAGRPVTGLSEALAPPPAEPAAAAEPAGLAEPALAPAGAAERRSGRRKGPWASQERRSKVKAMRQWVLDGNSPFNPAEVIRRKPDGTGFYQIQPEVELAYDKWLAGQETAASDAGAVTGEPAADAEREDAAAGDSDTRQTGRLVYPSLSDAERAAIRGWKGALGRVTGYGRIPIEVIQDYDKAHKIRRRWATTG